MDDEQTGAATIGQWLSNASEEEKVIMGGILSVGFVLLSVMLSSSPLVGGLAIIFLALVVGSQIYKESREFREES